MRIISFFLKQRPLGFRISETSSYGPDIHQVSSKLSHIDLARARRNGQNAIEPGGRPGITRLIGSSWKWPRGHCFPPNPCVAAIAGQRPNQEFGLSAPLA
jgi:hypothetical protein